MARQLWGRARRWLPAAPRSVDLTFRRDRPAVSGPASRRRLLRALRVPRVAGIPRATGRFQGLPDGHLRMWNARSVRAWAHPARCHFACPICVEACAWVSHGIDGGKTRGSRFHGNRCVRRPDPMFGLRRSRHLFCPPLRLAPLPTGIRHRTSKSADCPQTQTGPPGFGVCSYSSFVESNRIVTGPSFARATRIVARNTPVLTVRFSARSRSRYSS